MEKAKVVKKEADAKKIREEEAEKSRKNKENKENAKAAAKEKAARKEAAAKKKAEAEELAKKAEEEAANKVVEAGWWWVVAMVVVAAAKKKAKDEEASAKKAEEEAANKVVEETKQKAQEEVDEENMQKNEGGNKIQTEKGAKKKGEEQAKTNAEEDAKKKNEKECKKTARNEAKTTCRSNRFGLLTVDREQEDITWRCYLCNQRCKKMKKRESTGTWECHACWRTSRAAKSDGTDEASKKKKKRDKLGTRNGNQDDIDDAVKYIESDGKPTKGGATDVVEKEDSTNKNTAKKDTAKKVTTKNGTAKKVTTKKDTTKNGATKKNTAKKGTTKKDNPLSIVTGPAETHASQKVDEGLGFAKDVKAAPAEALRALGVTKARRVGSQRCKGPRRSNQNQRDQMRRLVRRARRTRKTQVPQLEGGTRTLAELQKQMAQAAMSVHDNAKAPLARENGGMQNPDIVIEAATTSTPTAAAPTQATSSAQNCTAVTGAVTFDGSATDCFSQHTINHTTNFITHISSKKANILLDNLVDDGGHKEMDHDLRSLLEKHDVGKEYWSTICRQLGISKVSDLGYISGDDIEELSLPLVPRRKMKALVETDRMRRDKAPPTPTPQLVPAPLVEPLTQHRAPAPTPSCWSGCFAGAARPKQAGK